MRKSIEKLFEEINNKLEKLDKKTNEIVKVAYCVEMEDMGKTLARFDRNEAIHIWENAYCKTFSEDDRVLAFTVKRSACADSDFEDGAVESIVGKNIYMEDGVYFVINQIN